jgi:hypothetical protein
VTFVPLPGCDFQFSYGNPYDAAAQEYIVAVSNAALYCEGSVRTWKPNTGGATLETSPA